MPIAPARLRAALLCCALILLATPAIASAKVLRGTSMADRLTGSAAADTIKGLGGSDVINGLQGRDRVEGGAGNDIIRADGQDVVVAGAGADRIQLTADATTFNVNCGAGRDKLTITVAPGTDGGQLKRRARSCEKVSTPTGPVPSTGTAPVTGTTPGGGLAALAPAAPQNVRTTARPRRRSQSRGTRASGRSATGSTATACRSAPPRP